MSRRLIWLGPVPGVTVATWFSRTMRMLPSPEVEGRAKGRRSRSWGVLRDSGARRTLTS